MTLCLFVLRFNVPFNNFSVMSEQIQDPRLASDLSVGHPEYRFSCGDAHLTTVNSGYVWPLKVNSFYIQNLASNLSVGHSEYRFSRDDAHLTTVNFGYVWPSKVNSFYIQNYMTLTLFVSRFNVAVNNFSVMSGQIHDSRLASDLSVGRRCWTSRIQVFL